MTHDDLSLVTQAGESPLGVSAVTLAVGLVTNCETDRSVRLTDLLSHWSTAEDSLMTGWPRVERTLGSEVGVLVLERLINSSDRVLRLELNTKRCQRDANSRGAGSTWVHLHRAQSSGEMRQTPSPQVALRELLTSTLCLSYSACSFAFSSSDSSGLVATRDEENARREEEVEDEASGPSEPRRDGPATARAAERRRTGAMKDMVGRV